MMQRWLFHDPDGVLPDWRVPTNPGSMDSPDIADVITVNTADGVGTSQDYQGQSLAKDWSFTGVLYSLADVDTLFEWVQTTRLVHVTDHFGMTWEMQLVSAEEKRAGTRRSPERHTYQAKALLIGAVA